MLIAVGLFVLIATFALGAILSIFDANRKAQSSKTVVDNFNLAIENMTRVVRFGDHYYCGVSSNLSSVNDCAGGGNSISVTFNGGRIVYRLNGTAMQKSDDGGSNYTDITAPEAKIEYLRFYVFNSTIADSLQPYILVVIKGHVGEKLTTQTAFFIETLMSQRTLDI
jgi:type II secretory pathway pseudopilin PulG